MPVRKCALDFGPDDRAEHGSDDSKDHHLRHTCFQPSDAFSKTATNPTFILSSIQQLLELPFEHADGAENLAVSWLCHREESVPAGATMSALSY